MDALGSQQNLTLAALARNRRVLFVESDTDFTLIRRFARRLGYSDLGAGLGLTHARSGSFGSNNRVRILAEGIEQALSMRLLIGAVYDRDYFCDEQITDVEKALRKSLAFSRILPCKEIENFLLVPSAIQRALCRALADRGVEGHILDVEREIDAIAESLREDVSYALTGKFQDWHVSSRDDRQAQVKQAHERFKVCWATPESRRRVLPGKQVLGLLREKVAQAHGVSLSDSRIIDAMHVEEIDPALKNLIVDVEAFRTANAT